jgi:ribose 5-phosphate isomerase A
VTQERRPFSEMIEHALEMIKEGDIVGLGSGRAATAFIQELGVRVRGGLRIEGIPTSEATAVLARQLGISLSTLNDVAQIDIDFDGADEVDPHLNLIKGYGAAFVREKIVATAAKQLVILVGPEKLVPVLGSRGRLPVEVVPFGLGPCRRRLAELGYSAVLRSSGEDVVVTDNGNYILDCQVSAIADPAGLDAVLREIPGVVGTGLFIGMAHTVLIQRDANVEIRRRK